MTDWRDDLPPIPSERIRTEAMREGFRRRERRAKRQRAVLYGGVGTAVVALIALIVVQSRTLPSENAGDDAAGTAEATTATTEAAAPETTFEGAPATTALSAPEETTPATEAPATNAPATTE